MKKFLLMLIVVFAFTFTACKNEEKDCEECTCPSGAETICNDGMDNDGDDFIDCEDADCLGDDACLQYIKDCPSNFLPGDECVPGSGFTCSETGGVCSEMTEDATPIMKCVCESTGPVEICNNGLDDDGDDYIDCEDQDCLELEEGVCDIYTKPCNENFLPGDECVAGEGVSCSVSGGVCSEADGEGSMICVCVDIINTNEICDNGLDDDNDGYADCEDQDCLEEEEVCDIYTKLCNAVLTPGEECFAGADLPCTVSGGICSEASDEGEMVCVCTSDATGITLEICDNGIDDDGDTFADCDDIDCEEDPGCQPGAEICDNGIDDNADGDIDCADEDCVNHHICNDEICNNDIDDDGDNLIDCDDEECVDDAICQAGAEICDNGIDDNADGDIDCADSDCNGQSCGTGCLCVGTSKSEVNCDDTIDNDGDGDADCDDSDCDADPACGGGGAEICDNSADNDGDTFAGCVDLDCQGDAACAGYLNECASGDNVGATCFPGFGKPCGSSGECADYDTDGDTLLDCVCP